MLRTAAICTSSAESGPGGPRYIAAEYARNSGTVKFLRTALCSLCSLWLNLAVFARKIRVEYEENGRRLPCPLKWLDSFSMRNFTNASIFDDTLPVADGVMEISTRVPLNQLQAAMEDWFQRKNYIAKGSGLFLSQMEME